MSSRQIKAKLLGIDPKGKSRKDLNALLKAAGKWDAYLALSAPSGTSVIQDVPPANPTAQVAGVPQVTTPDLANGV